MSGKAAKTVLTEQQQSVLQQIRRSRTAPQRLVQRVSIILLAFAGLLNVEIAPKVALARKQVGLWRRRWQQSFVRRGNFTSLVALKDRLLDFIDYFNRTFAKPFRWTYTGRPVTAETVKRPATWKESWASRRENGATLALISHSAGWLRVCFYFCAGHRAGVLAASRATSCVP